MCRVGNCPPIPLCSHPYFGRLESVLQFNNACAKFAMPQGWPFFFSITGLNCVYWGGDQNLGVQLTLFKGGGARVVRLCPQHYCLYESHIIIFQGNQSREIKEQGNQSIGKIKCREIKAEPDMSTLASEKRLNQK